MPFCEQQADIDLPIFRAPYDIPKVGAVSNPPQAANSFYPVFFWNEGNTGTRTFYSEYYCYLTPTNLAFLNFNGAGFIGSRPLMYDWYPAYDAGLVYQGEMDKILQSSHYGTMPLVPNFSNTRSYVNQPSRAFNISAPGANRTVARLTPMTDEFGRYLIGNIKYLALNNRNLSMDAVYVYDTIAPIAGTSVLLNTNNALYPLPGAGLIYPNYSSGSNMLLGKLQAGDMTLGKLRSGGFGSEQYEQIDFGNAALNAKIATGAYSFEGIFSGGFLVKVVFENAFYIVINHTATRWSKIVLQSQIGTINFSVIQTLAVAIDPNGVMYLIGNLSGGVFPVYYSFPMNLQWDPQVLRYDPSPIHITCWPPCISVG